MELFASGFFSIIIMLVLSIAISGLFMFFGARMAGVPATFGKSCLAAVATSVATLIISGVFSFLPGVGTALGFLASLAASLFIIKAIFDTTLPKALLVWVCVIIAWIVAGLLVGLLFGGMFAAGL